MQNKKNQKIHMEALKNERFLKQSDKQDTVKRIQRIQEYQKQQTMMTILEDNEKANAVKLQKMELLDQRRALRKNIDIQKQQLVETMEKIRRTGIIPQQFKDMMGNTSKMNNNN